MNRIISRLKCISCEGSLEIHSEWLHCTSCLTNYNILNQIPVFLPGDSTDFQALNSCDGQEMKKKYMRQKRASFSSLIRNLITSEYFPGREWRRAKEKTIQRGNLLIIGSGTSHYPDAVHMDLDAFPGVDVIGDATNLPFQNEAFDGVICEVVLEHVFKAHRVISETFRVLKPGGACFFIVPFLFPYHGHPADYRRWSLEGLKSDFSEFGCLETGIHGGPSSSMVNLLSEWCYILTGLKFPRGYTWVKGGATALLFPLKFFDKVINRFPEAHRLASTLYLYAEKRKKHV